MNKLLVGILLVTSFASSAQASTTDYWCKKNLNEKIEKIELNGIQRALLSMSVVGIVPMLFIDSKLQKYYRLNNSLSYATMSEDEILTSFEDQIKENYLPRDEQTIIYALNDLNENRQSYGADPMSLDEFKEFYDENYLRYLSSGYSTYIKNFAKRRKEQIKNGWPFSVLKELLNKKTKTKLTVEQVKNFMLEQKNTDYFCPGNKVIKLNKRNLIQIAKDIEESSKN